MRIILAAILALLPAASFAAPDFDQGKLPVAEFLQPADGPALEGEVLSSKDWTDWWPFKKEWTVLVYINAKNNLERFGLKDVNEMEAVGSTRKVNVVVELGRLGYDEGADAQWAGVRRYLIKKDADPNLITSPVVEEFKADMGSAAHLREFAQWGMKKYPAKRTLLIVWNHGSGWGKDRKPKRVWTQGISYDDETNNHITTPQLREVLASLGRVDVYASDACLMQMAEVAYELKDHAAVVVGSEEVEPGDGYPYEPILRGLTARPAMGAEDLGRLIVDSYAADYAKKGQETTQSALRTSALPGLARLTDEWLTLAMDESQAEPLRRSKILTLSFDDWESKDFADFARVLGEETDKPALKAKGAELASYITDKLVVANATTGDRFKKAGGLAVWLPNGYSDDYDALRWSRDTRFDDFLRWRTTLP